MQHSFGLLLKELSLTLKIEKGKRRMNLTNILTATVTLFAVIDMVGNIPLIINLRETRGSIESRKSTIIATCIMVGFLFLGTYVFQLLGISNFHFALAGSFLLLYFGVRMVLGLPDVNQADLKNPTVFPVAFPLIAGPGTLSTLMSFSYTQMEIIIAILINSIIIYVVLKSAEWLQSRLGKNGITIMERVFGVLLIAIAMKMLIGNLILSINDAQLILNNQ